VIRIPALIEFMGFGPATVAAYHSGAGRTRGERPGSFRNSASPARQPILLYLQ